MHPTACLATQLAGQRLAVLGGGLTGLSTAFYLSRQHPDAQIVLLEGSPRYGGWVRSVRATPSRIRPALLDEHAKPTGEHEEVIFEAGPRSVRPRGLEGWLTLDLVRQLGLTKELLVVDKNHVSAFNRFIYYPDKLVKLPSGITSLLRATLSSDSVLRSLLPALLGEPFRRRKPEQALQTDESVHSFFSRRFGDAFATNLVSGMVHGIYAGDTRTLSVGATFGSIAKLEQQYGSLIVALLRGGVKSDPEQTRLVKELQDLMPIDERTNLRSASVWSLRGGLETLTLGLEMALRRADNVTLSRDDPIQSIAHDPSGFTVSTTSTKHVTDRIVSTLSGPSLSSLLSADMPELTANGSVNVGVVNLAFANKPGKRLLPVRGFGYLLPRSVPEHQNPYKALGAVFDSDMMPEMHPPETEASPGYTKLSVLLGGAHWTGRSIESLPTDDELEIQALATVQSHLGISDLPTHSRVHMQRDCIPQYLVGHPDRMRTLHERIAQTYRGRLSVAGASYTGVGLNNCVKAAWSVSRAMATEQVTGLESFLAS
ncbi:uncharacterized protein L969DRAFT_48038 [Mixia osmundae IAM 14324]|uniref:Protoporphyrinogen oxidase n=1 Tax=Mixia osmundae (strain CBS 9802 / IAM 14324 / JCM 22182 / KY 12970) TaxID=764103 RepID=G7E918_MIXOS|nr:uncharacterized protein L969DRAFT_48038 [Mixia osmundae IAM 14324]KEI40272.1 hypothetical protein L969DRAFT_48038 [Mixia osmundae IAM 14324]GAA99636.1 hypothetical protein E5Q_06337 [Mixia osmundae IAM 14324]